MLKTPKFDQCNTIFLMVQLFWSDLQPIPCPAHTHHGEFQDSPHAHEFLHKEPRQQKTLAGDEG